MRDILFEKLLIYGEVLISFTEHPCKMCEMNCRILYDGTIDLIDVFFFSVPLSESSILRSEMTAKPKESSTKTKQGGKGGVRKPSGSSVGVQDQALTFKSKVKSSGYTEAPRYACRPII